MRAHPVPPLPTGLMRTHQTAHRQKISFGGNFVMNTFVTSFSPLSIFFKAIQLFHADRNFIFAVTFQERNQTVAIS